MIDHKTYLLDLDSSPPSRILSARAGSREFEWHHRFMNDHIATPAVDQRLDGPGLSHINPADPAASYYNVLAKLRSPLTLRQLMIQPVRNGYIGQDHPIDPLDLPPTAAQLYPQIAG